MIMDFKCEIPEVFIIELPQSRQCDIGRETG